MTKHTINVGLNNALSIVNLKFNRESLKRKHASYSFPSCEKKVVILQIFDHPNMFYSDNRAGSQVQCNCSWARCSGYVSRSTYFRHQLKDVLAGHQRGGNVARPMAVEESFNEVDILISTLIFKLRILISILYAYL